MSIDVSSLLRIAFAEVGTHLDPTAGPYCASLPGLTLFIQASGSFAPDLRYRFLGRFACMAFLSCGPTDLWPRDSRGPGAACHGRRMYP